MKTLDEAADGLGDLAARPEFRRLQPLLERLAADLRTSDAAPWARVDLPSVFDTELGPPDGRRPANLLASLRGVLILAPVLITWWGIYRAVQAYRGLLEAPAPERAPFVNQSFLQLWTTGFAGRTWWTLDSVALLDALAIIAVIVVAVLVDRNRRHATLSTEKAQGELREALLDAKLALAAAGYDAPDRLSQNVADLVPVYRATVGQMLAAQREMASSLDQGRHIVAAMVQATENLRKAGTDVATNAGEVGRRVAELQARVGEFDTHLTALLGGVTGLGAQVPEVNRGMQEVLEGVREVGRRLQGVHERQDAIVENLSVVTDVPLGAAQAARRTADLALDAEARLGEAVAALPQQMEQLRDGLLQAVDRELAERRSATAELTSTTRETRESARLVRGAVDELVGEAHELAKLPPDIRDAVRQIASNLQRSRELVDRLDGVGRRQRWWNAFTRS
jgi:methyl-accepting chemotaxis protein